MKNLSFRAGAMALALFCAPAAFGQAKVQVPPGPVVPAAIAFGDQGATATQVTPSHPLPTEPRVSAAVSSPLTWSVTTTTTVGPWTPQLGRSVWLTKSTTDTASITVLVTTDGNCAHGVPLTAANGTYQIGAFVNVSTTLSENLGSETRVGAQWCATITPLASGTTDSGSLGQ